MAKSKFGKKQIAGVLLLSSTAIGTTASGTASANAFTKFIGSKVSHAYNCVTNSTVGKVVGIVGIVGITAILLAVARVPYRIRKLRFEYHRESLNNSLNELLDAIQKLISKIEYDLDSKVSANIKDEINSKNKEILELLKKFKCNIEKGERKDAASNFASLKGTFTSYSYEMQQLFYEIEKKYVTYTDRSDCYEHMWFKKP